MSDNKPNARRDSGPQRALDAVLAGKAGNPLHRALWLEALDRQLRPLLPPPLPSHCRLANVAGEQLVFLVDSPVWRAKLRLHETTLLDAARSIGLVAKGVTARISTVTSRLSPQTERPAVKLSAAAQQALQAALASLQDIQPTKSDGPATPATNAATGVRERKSRAQPDES